MSFLGHAATVSSIFAMASIASATTHTFQDGLDGYNGTQDTNLYYATGGEANYNVGGETALYFGYSTLSILSFDVSSLAGQEVTSAKLTIYISDNSDDGAAIPIQIMQLTDGNAGWQQGSHFYADATASAGEATGANLSHPGTPWTGDPGLYEPGIDFVATPIASPNFDFSAGADGTPITVDLPISLVQQWVDSVNAGLIITKDWNNYYARGPQIYSSEYGVQSVRPKLEVTVVPEPAAGLMLLCSIGLLTRRRRHA